MRAMAMVNHVKIVVRAICNRSQMLLSEPGIQLEGLAEDVFETFTPESVFQSLQAGGAEAEGLHLQTTDLAVMEDFMDTKRIPHKVIIDCSTSADTAGLTRQWLKRGIHVVTCNRLSGAGPSQWYRDCMEATRKSQVHWMYESTVGAQMPVINILHDTLQTGDRVTLVEGVLSGTLAYIFDRLSLDPNVRFSDAIVEAYEQVFTEPNACLDLAGIDTAHKAVIIARELGLEVELEDVDGNPSSRPH